MDIEKLVLSVGDVNAAIDAAIRNHVVTPAAARALLVILEESIHQLFPLAFSDPDDARHA